MGVIVRKINLVDDDSAVGCVEGWRDAVAGLASELHAPDGTRFVACAEAVLARDEALHERWVGVLGGARGVQDIKELRTRPAFHAHMAMCDGLWVLTPEPQGGRFEHTPVAVPTVDLQYTQEMRGASQAMELARAIADTAVYRSLPIPPSQAGAFRKFDLTVFVISYKRVSNVERILSGLANQSYAGSFEVIIWNNNPAERANLERVVAPFRDQLELNMLHSSRNFFCIVRLALPHLMRSELLMMCDDDVRPSSEFLRVFVEGYRQAGTRAVVGARGNTFVPHKLNWTAPHLVWDKWEHLEFWEAHDPPRELHFMHGSTCLMPRAALHELAGIELPRAEFILVDDYWTSFALSALLRWRLMKIEASAAFTFDSSAADPSVALYLSDAVKEQRTNFYIYHMRRGWPEGCSA